MRKLKNGRSMNETATEHDMGGGRSLRPATRSDIAQLRAHIVDAVDASPFYNLEFKTFEKGRLSEGFLRALIAADPWYVTLILDRGEIVGFIIQIPDQGVLWAAWIYVSPRMRQSAIAISAIRAMVRHWNNGCFHKISSLVSPANERYVAVLKRLGFSETALLRRHLFGEDYLLLEMPLTKSLSHYAAPISFSRLASLKARWRSLIGG